jgi:hypothetical protein
VTTTTADHAWSAAQPSCGPAQGDRVDDTSVTPGFAASKSAEVVPRASVT